MQRKVHALNKMQLFTKKMVMLQQKEQRNEDCLYWYFQTLKDLGDRAPYTKKADIYAIVARRVYISEKYCGKIIRRMIRDEVVVKKVTERVR